ncbi:MAG TPA: Lsr2 family protein [Mycobacteriales bacterium]|nr:Lsr2 family protein [Mycobacteriales bacterium]
MAQRTLVVLEDDIDGGEADETVAFALDGTSYEIDLNRKNAAALRDALAPYVGAARKASRARGRVRPVSSGRTTDLSAIRVWARDNGFQVSERGRISAQIREAYEAAH